MVACIEVGNALLIYALLLLICYALNTNAHTVHTYMPHHFKSRAKGQVACYSCISYTRDLASYKFLEFDPPSAQNISDLRDVLFKGNCSCLLGVAYIETPVAGNQSLFTIHHGGMRIPVYAERCAETRAGANPNFYGAQISICPNSENEHGACVKLKGRFNGEPYVYRHCWSEMWQDARPYQRQMSERCFSDHVVQNFVDTVQNMICFCEDDLCNGSSPHFTTRASSSLFLFRFFSSSIALFWLLFF